MIFLVFSGERILKMNDEQKKSRLEIMLEFGSGLNYIYPKPLTIRKKREPLPDFYKDEIIRLYEIENLNPTNIGVALGLTREAVRQKLKKYGIYDRNADKIRKQTETKHQKYYQENVFPKTELILELIANGKAIGAIFEFLGISQEFIYPFKQNNKTKLEEIRNLKRLNRKIGTNLRNRISIAIKNNQKSGHTLDLLGCSIKNFKGYLEKRFDKNMTWENYGSYWVIDHIRPCASFDLSKESEQKKCFNYTNLQPLTWSENSKKSDNYLG